MRYLLSLLLICWQTTAAAQWYETQGHAYVMQGSKENARNLAIENALKKALLVAGASVSSVQQVVNGLLTQDEVSIRATGNVNAFEIVNETYQGNLLSVTVRADIIPQSRQCFSADYRKSLLLTKSHLTHREQANIGGIYNIDSALIKRLASKIQQQGSYLAPKLSVKSSNEFSRYNNSLNIEKIKHISMSLGDMTDSQYVMFSEIDDVSFANEPNNGWQFWQEDEFERHFKLNIHIYNANNGELVFNKQYQNSAPWTFTKRALIDVNSTTFWQSQYGAVLDQTINQVITDIDDNMMCQPTRAKIVDVQGNQVRFNLGERHGVKLGDKFSLLHVKNFTSDKGKSYAGFNVSPFNVKVVQVSNASAVAETEDGKILDSIQLDDLVVRH